MALDGIAYRLRRSDGKASMHFGNVPSSTQFGAYLWPPKIAPRGCLPRRGLGLVVAAVQDLDFHADLLPTSRIDMWGVEFGRIQTTSVEYCLFIRKR